MTSSKTNVAAQALALGGLAHSLDWAVQHAFPRKTPSKHSPAHTSHPSQGHNHSHKTLQNATHERAHESVEPKADALVEREGIGGESEELRQGGVVAAPAMESKAGARSGWWFG